MTPNDCPPESRVEVESGKVVDNFDCTLGGATVFTVQPKPAPILKSGAVGHTLTDEDRAKGRQVVRAKQEARWKSLDAQADDAAEFLMARLKAIVDNPKSDPADRTTAYRVLGGMVGRRITARSEQQVVTPESRERMAKLLAMLTPEQLRVLTAPESDVLEGELVGGDEVAGALTEGEGNSGDGTQD